MTGSPTARTSRPGGCSAARKTRFGRPRRGGVFWWLFWGVLAGVCGAGLARLRASNSLDAWSPNHGAGRGLGAYLVIGADAREADIPAIERGVAVLPAVGRCIGPSAEPALALCGVTPERLTRGEDGSFVGIYCFAGPGVDGRTLHDQVAEFLRTLPSSGPACTLGGSAAFTAALDRTSQEGMAGILIGITVLGGLLLWGVSRSARVAGAGVGAILLALGVVLGAAGWHGVPLDMSLLLVPPLMISLGYSYAAHAGTRPDAASALIACGVTSALGVAAFGAADLPSIRSFAAWGAFGVVVVWLAVMTLTPAPSGLPPVGRLDRRMRACTLHLIRRGRGPLLIAGLATTVVGVALAPTLAVEAQPLHYFAPWHAIRAGTAVLEERLTGMLPFEVTAPCGVRVRPLLDAASEVRKVVDATAIAGGEGQTFWCFADNASLDALEPRFAGWESGGPAGLAVRGVAPQLLEVRRQMRRVAALSLPPMLLVGALATGVLGRSWRAAIAGLLATLVSVAALTAAAAVLRCTVQMPALMTGAIGIGVGLDDAMHVVWLRRRRSLPASLRACFRASVGSSAIAAACMLAFTASPFRPTAQFGLLMAGILTLAALADMVLLPALLAGARGGATPTPTPVPVPARVASPNASPA